MVQTPCHVDAFRVGVWVQRISNFDPVSSRWRKATSVITFGIGANVSDKEQSTVSDNDMLLYQAPSKRQAAKGAVGPRAVGAPPRILGEDE